jgi:hypothetical protein
LIASVPSARPLAVLLALIGLLVLSACGDLPKPFARDRLSGAANPLVDLRSGTGVTVDPAAGLPVPWNRLVALEVAEMLRERGIPAEAGGAGGLGHRLALQVSSQPGSGEAPGLLPLETTWRLSSDTGAVLAEAVSHGAVDARDWEQATPETAQALGEPIVALVAEALGGGGWGPGGDSAFAAAGGGAAPPPPRAAPTGAVTQQSLTAPPADVAEAPDGRKAPPPSVAADRPDPVAHAPAPAKTRAKAPDGSIVVALAPVVTEAPGSGARELEQAMATLIRAAGMPLTKDPAKATFAITGKVTTTPVAGGKEKVELVWVVSDPATGKEIGSAKQQNFIPQGMLDGAWGRLAYDISQAALEGIGDILSKPGR